jgi:hypothetical protein
VPSVRVSYDPAARKFKFVPYALQMDGPGIVVLTRHPGSAPWKFQTATFKDDSLEQFVVRDPGNGENLQIDDKFLNVDPDIYYYTVTILLDTGEEITSPDPVIVNDPGDK